MLVWLVRREPEASVNRVLPDPVRWTWWLALPLVLVIAWAWGLSVFGPLDVGFTVAHLGYRVLPPACAVWGAATIVLGIVVQDLRRQSLAERPGSASD